MAVSNVKKKIAALAELRKDPAAAIERAWSSFKDNDAIVGDIHESDKDLIEQVLSAVIADIRADKAEKPAVTTEKAADA